jgi:hypothetical protein
MAHGITLVLREIKPEPKIISSSDYKAKFCWPDGGCVTGVSDRATRRNRIYARKQFKPFGKLK